MPIPPSWWAADVAVQTIYARLGTKRGMLLALIDLIDQEAGVERLVEQVNSATTPSDTLSAGIHLTRVFQERCGDIIGALFSAAGAEPELTDAVAEGQRRHREGAPITIDRILHLNGLRDHAHPEHAQVLLALSTSHEAWRELTHSYKLSWDDAEAWLTDALALLKPATQKTKHLLPRGSKSVESIQIDPIPPVVRLSILSARGWVARCADRPLEARG